MSDPISISVFEDGPILVRSARSVTYCGEALPVEGDLYFCRCGRSSNAPFCDGTHRKVGFDGSFGNRTGKPIKVWEGRTVRTRFDPNACMHVFHCKPLAALREAELAGDDGAAAEILQVVRSCPSGALTAEAKAGGPDAAPGDAPVDIAVMEGGELRVQRAFEIDAERPEGLAGDRATLCRCGLSKNKPWCDGRHKGRNDFR